MLDEIASLFWHILDKTETESKAHLSLFQKSKKKTVISKFPGVLINASDENLNSVRKMFDSIRNEYFEFLIGFYIKKFIQ